MRYADLIKGFLLVVLLSLMAACGNDGETQLQGEDKQSVQVNITRATMDGNDWAWQNNDQVKMSIIPYGETLGSEHTLTYSNKVWSAANIGEIKLPATAEVWYPVSASATKFNYSHDNTDVDVYGNGTFWLEGTVDQSTGTSFANSDWMTSGQIQIGLTANMTLIHRLAKVTVNVPSDINEIRFLSYTSNDIDYEYITTTYVAIKPYVINKNTYTAIVSPYFYNQENIPFMWVTTGDNPTKKIVYLPRNLGTMGSLSPGKAYTFNLTINNANTRSAGSSECELELVNIQNMNER